jgi:hypothetical protein
MEFFSRRASLFICKPQGVDVFGEDGKLMAIPPLSPGMTPRAGTASPQHGGMLMAGTPFGEEDPQRVTFIRMTPSSRNIDHLGPIPLPVTIPIPKVEILPKEERQNPLQTGVDIPSHWHWPQKTAPTLPAPIHWPDGAPAPSEQHYNPKEHRIEKAPRFAYTATWA